MPLHFYHATTSKAALSIEQTQFRPGKRGYAGAAIYFSADPQQAIRHCFNGVSVGAEVVICCSVDLGRCLLAERKTVDKDECFARGYDSVHIEGTDTYAVYDSSRISIKDFTRISDDVCWYPSVEVEAKAKATTKAKASAKTTARPSTALETLVAAIQASPHGSLNVASDISQLCLKHPDLHGAIRAAGGLSGFCEAHAELIKDGHVVTMAKAKPVKVLHTLVAAIQASPNGCLDVSSKMGELYAKHPGLREAVRAAGGLTEFCEAQAELIKDGHIVTMAKAKPLAALQTLVAAIHASPNGSLDVGGDMGQLCLKHPDLREAIRAAGGLSGFCKAHPELARDGSRVVLVRFSLFKQFGRSQEIETKREEEARQMHARIRHEAEEERHQMKLQTEVRLRQEVALQLEVQREETARQREAARQQMQQKARQQQLRLSCEKDTRQQQHLQLNALSNLPLGALGSIISLHLQLNPCCPSLLAWNALIRGTTPP